MSTLARLCIVCVPTIIMIINEHNPQREGCAGRAGGRRSVRHIIITAGFVFCVFFLFSLKVITIYI